ncbi:MAG: DNA cytosine methyltransferase [Thermoproteales archaeon]|nr:DNA cytosine methyltransferase [Thermoproteales archaeon]
MAQPTFVDIFSGAGGSTLGFVKAGFERVGALDNYVYAVETFKKNFGVHPVFVDARRFDFARWSRELGDVDVLVGCPPCQGFSRMKNPDKLDVRGGSDPRNDLVYVYVKAVEALRPRVVVFENVSWMVKAYRGAYFKDLTELLSKMGYNISWKIIDAADYGVPQHRRRLILVGSIEGKFEFPEPTHGDPKSIEVREGLRRPWRTVRDAIADLPPLGPGEKHPYIPNHETKSLPENWLRLIRAIPKDGGSRKDAPPELWLPCHRRHGGHNDVFGRLAWNRPSNTITTGCWNPSKGRFVHPEQDRGLSLRECARLQGFPDDFTFHGPPTSVAKQIGNSLPPPLAEAVARKIKELF